MKKERYFTESIERTHTLVAQVKTKNDKWIDYEKFYSKPGYCPLDYINTYHHVKYRLRAIDKNPNADVRILNGMRKQVFGKAAQEINAYFGGSGGRGDGTLLCAYLRPLFDALPRDGSRTKIVSIRYKNSDLPDMLITNFNEEVGWDNFLLVLNDISTKNGGFKSFHKVAPTVDDDNLEWFKIKCNSGLEFSVACYQ